MKIATSIILTLILLLMGQSALAQAVKDVNVVNNPAVTVSNLPAVQTVDGAVNVANFPAIQPVSGTVNIGNMPDANEIPLPYMKDILCEEINSGQALCFFDVPAGKILQIENIDGWTRMGNVNIVYLQGNLRPGEYSEIVRIPTTASPNIYIYNVLGTAYFGDTDLITDGNGNGRDFRILVETTGEGAGGGTRCSIVGRLIPAT